MNTLFTKLKQQNQKGIVIHKIVNLVLMEHSQSQQKIRLKSIQNASLSLQNFANKIIELESALENSYSLSTLQKLRNLYRIGMECYALKEPKKSEFLRKKLITLLGDEECVNILQNWSKRNRYMLSGAHESKKYAKQKQETCRTNCSQSGQINTLDLLRLNIQNTNMYQSNNDLMNESPKKQLTHQLRWEMESADREMKDLVESTQKIAMRRTQLKEKDIQKQETDLRQRLHIKKMKKQRRASCNGLQCSEIVQKTEDKQI